MEKQSVWDRTLTFILYLSAICLGVYLLSVGISVLQEQASRQPDSFWGQLYLKIQEQTLESALPILVEVQEERKGPVQRLFHEIEEKLPFSLKIQKEAQKMVVVESGGMYEKIAGENSRFLQEQIRAENMEAGLEEENPSDPMLASIPVEAAVPLEKFQDYDFVMNNYFTVDQTTTLNSDQLNGMDLVTRDLRMKTDAGLPQILIYHTHSQEAFADSRPGEPADTIVGMGEYLSTLLREKYGYNVVHLTDVFDVVEGSLDRSGAYSVARQRITQVLEENPSIEVVIDLHRDGVAKDRHLVTAINGKPTAQIMFFNGLSRTTKGGEITSLPNPYIEDNLAFSLQMHLMADRYYPGLTRTIYLKGYRYNMHLRPKSLLVECGAQTNTVEEERNAMEPLADTLDKVLQGE